MISLSRRDSIIKVIISTDERITLSKANSLIRKSKRMIQQNNATSVIIELEKSSVIHNSAVIFFNRVVCKNSNFPIAIINS